MANLKMRLSFHSFYLSVDEMDDAVGEIADEALGVEGGFALSDESLTAVIVEVYGLPSWVAIPKEILNGVRLRQR